MKKPTTKERILKEALIKQVELYYEKNCRIFTEMMKQNLLQKDDPALLSMEFALLVSMYIQMFDRQPEREAECMAHMEKHLRHFIRTYGVR